MTLNSCFDFMDEQTNVRLIPSTSYLQPNLLSHRQWLDDACDEVSSKTKNNDSAVDLT